MWAGVELAKCSCSGEYWFLFVCYPWFLAGVPAHVPAAAAAGAPCGGGGGGGAASCCSLLGLCTWFTTWFLCVFYWGVFVGVPCAVVFYLSNKKHARGEKC